MAKRSRQSFLKRQRERQRSEKAALKRQKRLARKHGEAVGLEDDSLGEPRGVSLSEFGADPAPDAAAAPDVPQENPAVVETIPSKQD